MPGELRRSIIIFQSLGIYDKHALDRIIHVEDEEAFSCARRLAREEGILSGMSAGAALAGALRLARELDAGGESGFIVFICPDTGERYLSTTLFAPPARQGLAVHSVDTGTVEFLGSPSGGHALFTPGPRTSRWFCTRCGRGLSFWTACVFSRASTNSFR